MAMAKEPVLTAFSSAARLFTVKGVILKSFWMIGCWATYPLQSGQKCQIHQVDHCLLYMLACSMSSENKQLGFPEVRVYRN